MKIEYFIEKEREGQYFTIPFDVPNMRNMMVPVDPTAARASASTFLPTIIVSTMF